MKVNTSRWRCAVPSPGGGYEVVWLRFPWCLSYYLRSHPQRLWLIIVHILSHVFDADWNKINSRLLLWGFLYSAKDGDVLTWQWRFWRGSPLARIIAAKVE